MRAEEGSRSLTLTGFPRIVAETPDDTVELVAAAQRMPKVFPGLGPDVYLGLNPPFVVGTHISENAILGWQQTAATDPTAAENLARLGVAQEGAQTAAPSLAA